LKIIVDAQKVDRNGCKRPFFMMAAVLMYFYTRCAADCISHVSLNLLLTSNKHGVSTNAVKLHTSKPWGGKMLNPTSDASLLIMHHSPFSRSTP
jgi:hypothetical protein